MLSQQYSFLSPQKALYAARNKIETNPNYQPNITDEQLLALVVNKDGSAVHTPRRSAMAIKPFRSTDAGLPVSAMYQVRIALKGLVDDTEYPQWHIDATNIIVVGRSGDISLHTGENVNKQDFTAPLDQAMLDRILSFNSLHQLPAEVAAAAADMEGVRL